MKAAVVSRFEQPPRYGDYDQPIVREGEVLVHVHAAALSQLVRAQAAGKHYSSGKPPLVPGADGVGRLEDGQRVYFAFPRAPVGAMAQCVAVKTDQVIALPDEVDDITAAAIANPGMSSWAALTERAKFKPGEAVLINGAAGISGRLAIQIARHLGAGRIIATARKPELEAELRSLGADSFVCLKQAPEQLVENFHAEIAHGIDVVLDYLWGPPAEAFLTAASSHGSGVAARRIRYVNIGSLAGANLALNASVLRSSGLELLGSGLGSVSNAKLVQCVAALMHAITPAGLRIDARAVPLTEVESVWSRDADARMVFTLQVRQSTSDSSLRI